MLSVIIPAYNEEVMIESAYSEIKKVLSGEGIAFEAVFVDDGSKDGTWDKIDTVSRANPEVRGIRFSRNFGKEAAIMAGLAECVGECAVVIDCDLQHPPEKIVDMYRMWQEGYEVIEGKKKGRQKEGLLHSVFAKIFYSVISKATGVDMTNASDFKLLDRKAIDVLVNMREKNAFFRALSSWIGFRTASVEFEVRDRAAGRSKWSSAALTRYAINNVSSFSTAPMQLVTVFGVIVFIISVVLGIIALVQKLSGAALEGFTTVILIQLFSASITMMSLGIIGYYIARIYEEIKGRPRYIISEKCGEEKDR